MFRAKITPTRDYKMKEVDVINVQLVPSIRMKRDDLEYSIEQVNEIHVIYIDEQGEITSDTIEFWDDIQIVK